MNDETASPAHGSELEVLWCLGERQTVLVAGERSAEHLSAVEHEAAAGHSPPWHRQPADDEAFYVLDGEISFWIGTPHASPRRAGPGEFVFIARGEPHSFRVESPQARWLTIHTPSGHERFYRAAGTAAAGGGLPPPSEPDMARVQAAAREHGVELLGPPPGAGQSG